MMLAAGFFLRHKTTGLSKTGLRGSQNTRVPVPTLTRCSVNSVATTNIEAVGFRRFRFFGRLDMISL